MFSCRAAAGSRRRYDYNLIRNRRAGSFPSAGLSFRRRAVCASGVFCFYALIPRTAVGHCEREYAAFAGEAFGGYARVVEIGDLFDEREAEAEAAA